MVYNMLNYIVTSRYEKNKYKIKEILDSLTNEEKFALHDYLDLEERIEDVKIYMEYEFKEYIDDEELIVNVAKRLTFGDYDCNYSLNDHIEEFINYELNEREVKNGK